MIPFDYATISNRYAIPDIAVQTCNFAAVNATCRYKPPELSQTVQGICRPITPLMEMIPEDTLFCHPNSYARALGMGPTPFGLVFNVIARDSSTSMQTLLCVRLLLLPPLPTATTTTAAAVTTITAAAAAAATAATTTTTCTSIGPPTPPPSTPSRTPTRLLLLLIRLTTSTTRGRSLLFPQSLLRTCAWYVRTGVRARAPRQPQVRHATGRRPPRVRPVRLPVQQHAAGPGRRVRLRGGHRARVLGAVVHQRVKGAASGRVRPPIR
jgi:hypothetical protein